MAIVVTVSAVEHLVLVRPIDSIVRIVGGGWRVVYWRMRRRVGSRSRWQLQSVDRMSF